MPVLQFELGDLCNLKQLSQFLPIVSFSISLSKHSDFYLHIVQKLNALLHVLQVQDIAIVQINDNEVVLSYLFFNLLIPQKYLVLKVHLAIHDG